jgi:hypothetical protein
MPVAQAQSTAKYASSRIVEYLAETHGIAINTAFFSTFEHNGETLLATDWLLKK